MEFFPIVFLVILLKFCSIQISAFFFSRSKSITSKDCCIKSKINVNWIKANLGKDFLRQLTIDSDLYEEATPENMCYLIHFLFQQASINNKPVTINEEVFVLFDSSKRVFNRIINSKDIKQHKLTSFEHKFRQYLKRINPFKKTDTKINDNSTDRYPTYGMNIPDSCLPNNFDRIFLGELPSFPNEYDGQRIFIKPDRVAFRDVKTFVKQRFCQLIHGETKSQCVKIRVFQKNNDKIILNKWIKVLSKLRLDQQYKKRAIQYGIYEIDQQARDLEATASTNKDIKQFRKLLIEKYGQDFLRIRQGREIILTTMKLKESPLTCESRKDNKHC